MAVLVAAALLASGLHGIVTRGPVTPVCRVGRSCNEPVVGGALVFVARGRVVARVRTGAGGRYSVRLAPGVYSVRLPTTPRIGFGVKPTTVRVVRGASRRLDFTIDTGIRQLTGRHAFYAVYRRLLIRGISRAHRAVYRASRGRILGSVVGMPVLLLTTTGGRSGKERTTPLTFLRDGADLVVVASNGGADRPPDWWLNLERNRHAVVQIGNARARVTSRTASAEERERLWPVITAAYSGYATYQQRTSRQIPVVLLTAE